MVHRRCTLLLGNTLVNAQLAILTASITSGVLGGIISTVFILIFGEIIPQSFCSRYGARAHMNTSMKCPLCQDACTHHVRT